MLEVYPGGHPVVLVALPDGVFAIDGRCPHRGGPMAEGKLDGCLLRCPWHGFKYDVRTGVPVWPEGWDAAPVYAARLRDGLIELLIGKEP